MSAVISECGAYRYRLERPGPGPFGPTAVIMVNPSTADAEVDDATIRKLMGFGLLGGWGRIVVGNLFAFRATDVRALSAAEDPIGPENNRHLVDILLGARQVVFAWGAPGKFPRAHAERWRYVNQAAHAIGRTPMALGAPTKDGHPRHPLMLAYASRLAPWAVP